jgi:RNA polymerase sigma factor (sigma-70 family)
MNNDLLLCGVPEEKLLAETEDALAREATEDSRNKLVLHNMREAFYYARHVCRGRLPEDEIFSAVYGALAHAVKNYKPGTKLGIRFFAYAKPYVRGAICKEWKTKDVVKNAKHESLDKDIGVDDDLIGGELDGAKQWEVEAARDPEFESIHIGEQMEFLKPLLHSLLSDHERMVIELAYFGHFNFEDIAKQLGVTRSAVQNTHTRAIQKLRAGAARKERLLKRKVKVL